MSVSTNKLIFVSYGVFAVVLGMVCLLFTRAQWQAMVLPELAENASIAPRDRQPAPGAEAVSRRLHFEVARQGKQIAELQQLLEKREGILRLQASKIQNTDEQFAELQQEADDYLEMLFDVIQTTSQRVDGLARLEAAPRDGNSSVASEEEETLRMALDAAQWELEQSQQMAQQQAEIAAEAVSQVAAMQQAVQDLGDLGTPLLIGLLGDADVEIRAWAATSLGQLPHPSQAVLDALQVTTEDASSTVRDAAQRAVEELRARW